MPNKKHVNVVFVGHVGSGKSTTAGHLLMKLGAIDKRALDRLEKETTGKHQFKYAWAFDSLKAERTQRTKHGGQTIDLKLAKLVTPTTTCTIMDTPGEPDFLTTAISGITQADCAVLLVDGRPNSFDMHSDSIKTFAQLIGCLGITNTICAVNYMDSCNYAREKFHEATEKVQKLLKKGKVNLKVPPVFLPISGYFGDNLLESSPNMEWWVGPTLMGALEAIEVVPRPLGKALRLPIQEVFKVGGIGTVPAGRVEGGVLKPGMQINIAPMGVTTDIKSIEMHHESRPQAVAGESVGFSVKGFTVDQFKRGYIVSDAADQPARPAVRFQARIGILQEPCEKKGKGIAVGYTPVVHIHTAHVACKFVKMTKLDGKGAVVAEDTPSIKMGDNALVELEPVVPLVVETFDDYPALGRFVIRDVQKVVAIGRVMKVWHEGELQADPGKS